MKHILCTLFFLAFAMLAKAQVVTIPDANFKAALLADFLINTNLDNEIQVSEAQAATVVLVNNKNISDLTGIEAFVNAVAVNFRDNNVSTADLSDLSKLVSLFCQDNQLTSLKLDTSSTSLERIYAQDNQLTSLELASSNLILDFVDVRNNQLANITLPDSMPALRNINLSNNQLTSVDFSSAPIITRANIDYNQLTSIRWSTNGIFSVSFSHNQLTNLNIQQGSDRIDCSNNPLDSLWYTATIGTPSIICDSSQLRYIFINEDVDSLDVSYNMLDTFEVSGFSNLEYLNCSYNNIRNFYDNRGKFVYLNLSNNQLNRLGIYDSNNNNVFPLDANSNIGLQCIETNVSIPNAQSNWTIPTGAVISIDCNGIWTSINNLSTLPNVQIYPNPTPNSIQLDLGQRYEEVSISIYNSLGQEVAVLQKENLQQTTVEMPSAKGYYILQIQTEKGQQSFSVIKE